MRGSATPAASGFDAVIALPFGPFGIRSAGGAVAELVFLPPDTALHAPANETARLAAEALHGWIDDPERPFPLPLLECGTAFQRRVWAEISAIPTGQTRSYGELSARLGSAARAVGQACGANPYPLVVPCHRVTSSSGLGGFANASGGWLLDVKRWLLRHEGAA
ncbi:methylated-DNA--[protein]-cysteine S-methyltransferase [Thauera linaloolentis]|uniref:methylated-DNA--[protein]-cysteine S-methyltransferase n=1 Tax=Thauera linaloolentis (strain DSM 12138 / JCM 21573 / CCUG 41526 / CIP 105981 / IAM 15112 / NBRC 102519 / 47Lol) TaxID=1123367 RepID=N6Z593_THAL4|nr:methylated-DNA--[protein]-cysteine S-methyltransferase [Thauera linaloolentis]ENO89737.1 methylated-DNA/protein-cysteine methyltransferase [Thauera linaloolentis 47Lol = DSM 12138]MCM8566035.1 methylated-DNA--[protein]-cysteine S-methyltransferase [Thauera linaloolentis]